MHGVYSVSELIHASLLILADGVGGVVLFSLLATPWAVDCDVRRGGGRGGGGTLALKCLQAARRAGCSVDAVRRVAVDLLFAGVRRTSTRGPRSPAAGRVVRGVAVLTSLSAGARRSDVQSVYEGRGPGILDRTDDSSRLAGSRGFTRQTAGTAGVGARVRRTAAATTQVAQSDGPVVGRVGARRRAAELAVVEELGARWDATAAVDAVARPVSTAST